MGFSSKDKILAVEEAKKSKFLNRMADLYPVIVEVSREARKIHQILLAGDLLDVDLDALFHSWSPERRRYKSTGTVNTDSTGVDRESRGESQHRVKRHFSPE